MKLQEILYPVLVVARTAWARTTDFNPKKLFHVPWASLWIHLFTKTRAWNFLLSSSILIPAIFNKWFYYISKLVRALWLVNLAGRTLLHGPLKFKFFLLPDCCVIYRQTFSTYKANKSLKLSFTLNCVLKRSNDLKTISNWFLLFWACLRNLKPFLMNGNRSRTLQTHNRDIINILLTSSSQSVQ